MLSVLIGHDEDQTAAFANNLAGASEYGPSAALSTERLEGADEFLDRLEIGQAPVNLLTSRWGCPSAHRRVQAVQLPAEGAGVEAPGFYTRAKTWAGRAA